MNVVERAKAILLQPAQTWPVIDAEPASVASIYKDWLIIMAAIPAVCGFIGTLMIGGRFFSGLIAAILGYILAFVGVLVMGFIIDALAPTFNGQKNFEQALKLVVYSATASWIGGIFSLIPALAIIGMLGSVTGGSSSTPSTVAPTATPTVTPTLAASTAEGTTITVEGYEVATAGEKRTHQSTSLSSAALSARSPSTVSKSWPASCG